MRTFPLDELVEIPWKNGGGITREIAKATGPKGFAWRLSIADVTEAGPFSTFPGMTRILTVIDGDGLVLTQGDVSNTLRLCEPFRFSGDVLISSNLLDVSIRDFNVIFDTDIIEAQVSVVSGQAQLNVPSPDSSITAVFGIAGHHSIDGKKQSTGTTTLIDRNTVQLTVPNGSRCLLVNLISA